MLKKGETYAPVTADGKLLHIKKEASRSITRETESLPKTSPPLVQEKKESSRKRKEMPQTKGNTKKSNYQGSFQYKSSFDPRWTD